MIERRFILEDLDGFKIREEDKGRDLNKLRDNIDKIIAYSYLDNDKVIGIVGVVVINENTCEIFLLLDECAENYKREIYRLSIEFIEKLQETFVRIQAIVRTDWERGIKYLFRLGFEQEGRLRKFTPEDDYYLFARVREW